jgi:hypothetical protein
LNIAGQSQTVTQAAATSVVPGISSVSPHAGIGAEQLLTLVVTDGNSAANIRSVEVRINDGTVDNAARGCVLELTGSEYLRILSDDGTGWYTAGNISVSSEISNTQCTADLAQSAVYRSGNDLTLSLALKFHPAFTAGGSQKKNVCIMATDNSNLTSGWSCIAILYPNAVTGQPVNRYRIFIPQTDNHLFTADKNEYDTLGRLGFKQEGIAEKIYDAPVTVSGVQAVPLYRIYFQQPQRHFWTTDRNEYLTLIRFQGMYLGEGVDGFVMPQAIPGSVPQHRLLHPIAFPPVHHWTTNDHEYRTLVSWGWIDEGIPAWVLPPPPNAHAAAMEEAEVTTLSSGPRVATRGLFRRGAATALNADGEDNSSWRPAARGSVVTLTIDNGGDGSDLEAWIGGHPAPILYAVPTHDSAKIAVQLRIPDNIAPGEATLVLKSGQSYTQPGVLISVE